MDVSENEEVGRKKLGRSGLFVHRKMHFSYFQKENIFLYMVENCFPVKLIFLSIANQTPENWKTIFTENILRPTKWSLNDIECIFNSGELV